MSKLKPCPFCGSEAGIPTNLDGTPVDYEITDCSCKNDDCLIAGYWTPIKIWQTRPIEDELLDRIAELEAENDQLTVHDATERQDDKWIPVSERLPEENQQILSTDGKEFYLDYYARWEGKDNPPCFCDGLSLATTPTGCRCQNCQRCRNEHRRIKNNIRATQVVAGR